MARLDSQRLLEAIHACGFDARRISKHFGVSIRHLQRWFAADMASTPRVWLSEQRLQLARQLLATASSVKEVAFSLGFKQASQFSRDYKRRFGHQPSAELARERTAAQPSHSRPASPDGKPAAGRPPADQ